MKKIYSSLSGIALLLLAVNLPACNHLDQKQTASATPADHVQVEAWEQAGQIQQ